MAGPALSGTVLEKVGEGKNKRGRSCLLFPSTTLTTHNLTISSRPYPQEACQPECPALWPSYGSRRPTRHNILNFFRLCSQYVHCKMRGWLRSYVNARLTPLAPNCSSLRKTRIADPAWISGRHRHNAGLASPWRSSGQGLSIPSGIATRHSTWTMPGGVSIRRRKSGACSP